MDVRFIGPIGKVSGSCTWMRDTKEGWNFLVDCGMQQGEPTATDWNQAKWPFNPSEIKFVILTHAHIDHCGLIPALYRDGFNGTVYCTMETAELARISLADAAKFSNSPFEAEHIGLIKWHEPQGRPLLGNFHPVDRDLYLQFFRSGHIVGAVSVTVYWGPKSAQKSIAFSGDVGPAFEDKEYLPLVRFNMNPFAADYAVIESTYGATVRPQEQKSATARREALRKLLDQVIHLNGTLVLPAFALGRTQNLIFDLTLIYLENPEKYAAIDFMIDSPAAKKMHKKILEAFSRSEPTTPRGEKVRPVWLGKQFFRTLGLDDKTPEHHQRANEILAMTLCGTARLDPDLAAYGNELARGWKGIFRYVDGKKRGEFMNRSRGSPTVVIVSSGMCDGGPAAFWVPHVLGETKNHIALTGYCASGSVGRQLADVAAIPAAERLRHSGTIRWEGDASPDFQVRDIRASISTLSGYSEHADQPALIDWLIRERGDKWTTAGGLVFIQHGEDFSRKSLAEAIERRTRDVGVCLHTISPDETSYWFDLDKGGEAVVREKRRNELLLQRQKIELELATL